MSGKDGGWALPETINPENEICVTLNIPDEPRYIAAFWGALYELTYWNNWQRDPDHKGAQVAAVWKSIWLYYSGIQGDCDAMCCCPEPLKRVLPDGTVQTSTDGGLTWQNTPSADPRETSILFPPLPGEDGATKACKAAENIVGMFQSNVEQFIDDLGVLTSIAAVAAAVTSVIVIVLSGGTLLPAVTALAAALTRAGASGIAAAFTSEVWERLNCNIYCVMGEDGRLEQADLTAIKAKVNEDESGVAAEILNHLIDNYGIVGMNNLATLQGEGTGETCTECECPAPDWCINFDFSTGNQYGFTSAGTWDGTGFLATDPVTVGGQPRYRTAGLNFFTVPAGSRLTAITMYFERPGACEDCVNEVGVTAEDGQIPSIEEVVNSAITTGFLTSGLTTLDWDGAARVYAAVDAVNSGEAKLTRVWVSGTGDIPTEWEGYPNCE